MAEEFNDLSFGDETRRNGDYVSVPVDSETDPAPQEGDAVGIDDGVLVRADAADEAIGVLYTYQYFEEASAGEQIDYDRDATVKVGGTVKAEVVAEGDGAVEAGDPLTIADGAFTSEGADGLDSANYVAISDAEEQVGGPRNESQHIDDRDGDHFAEVLLR